MEADELFDQALTNLPEAVGDLLRDRRDPSKYVFATFDGASELGMALIASDLVSDGRVRSQSARAQVERMIRLAEERGEELVVSMMVTCEVLGRMLTASRVDSATRVAVALWLETPVGPGHFRVVAVAGTDVRAAVVDSFDDVESSEESTPTSSTLLN